MCGPISVVAVVCMTVLNICIIDIGFGYLELIEKRCNSVGDGLRVFNMIALVYNCLNYIPVHVNLLTNRALWSESSVNY